MSDRSAQVAGALTGVVLLGAVAAFGIALPKATGDEEEQQATEIVLPDTLPHGLVAEDVADEAGGPEAEEYAGRVAEIQESAIGGLEEIFGEPAAIRGYASDDGTAQATVTVLDTAPGLFDPHGPPIDPELLQLERSIYELRRVGDAVCDLYWQQVVPEGQPVDDSADPAAVQCQLGDGDRTLEIFGSGLSADDAVEILESLQDQ
ncbi:MAG TPA: hypothetical protein VFO49_01475 [Nocardioides sp.]|nr:hypothetical protein [Nocardioides sp.]